MYSIDSSTRSDVKGGGGGRDCVNGARGFGGETGGPINSTPSTAVQPTAWATSFSVRISTGSTIEGSPWIGRLRITASSPHSGPGPHEIAPNDPSKPAKAAQYLLPSHTICFIQSPAPVRLQEECREPDSLGVRPARLVGAAGSRRCAGAMRAGQLCGARFAAGRAVTCPLPPPAAPPQKAPSNNYVDAGDHRSDRRRL